MHLSNIISYICIHIMAGLYIHIPFCASRCIYCGFYSTTQLSQQDRYVDALCREMELRPLSSDPSPLTSVYLGGGTPSQLSPKNLERLFLYICKVYGDNLGAIEVTMECNPDDVTQGFVETLRRLPVNRVSLGAQTFSDERLRFLHRRHSASQVKEAVARLRGAGIGNISIDLMFGFPGETLESWAEDIAEALKLDVEHISAYSLMYEEGTPLMELIRKGEAGCEDVTDEELSRAMYELLIDRMEAAGYEHYEISNWARAGFRSRHNSSYWQGIPYIGIGAAAHSFDVKTRSWNVSDLRSYMEAIEQGTLPSESETLDDRTRYNDLVTTALRTRDGIALSTLSQHRRHFLLENAGVSLRAGLLRLEQDHLSLTRQGLFVSDAVMADLIDV